MSPNYLMFYGGIGTLAIGVLIGISFLIYYKISGIRLDAAFDKEYGEKIKKM